MLSPGNPERYSVTLFRSDRRLSMAASALAVRHVLFAAAILMVAALRTPLRAQSPAVTDTAAAHQLALGYAVDTTMVPGAWWGVDPARSVLAEVVRTWRDYLTIRRDPAKRASFWSAADRVRAADPDPLLVSESYLLDGRPILVEALPIVGGDPSRWVLRTIYVRGGTADRPGILGMERVHIVREPDANGRVRWALASPTPIETADWQHTRVGRIEYVVHPALRFNAARAAETARWADALSKRFHVADTALVTYYQVPDLQAGFHALGLDLALSADRVGGRANPLARVVVAADPRYAEAYYHELVHVLLHPIAGGRSAFVGEGIAYWLGGARGQTFQGMMRDLAGFLAARPGVRLERILAPEGDGTLASARFPSAAAVFELVHRANGDDGVRRFVDALGTAEPSVADVARALGTTPGRVEADWRGLVTSFAR